MELDRFDWLAKRHEAPIDPQRRIVDPHHHLWDGKGQIANYLIDDLLADVTAGHNVVKTVFVDCKASYDHDQPGPLKPVGETRFVAEQATIADDLGGPTIAAIVSHADMTLGDAVENVLAAHDAAGGGRFRGIRHATAWDELLPHGHTKLEPEMMTTAEFADGVGKLGAMGYSFDAWLYHTQLGELAELARQAPTTQIILDHMGGPLGIDHYGQAREATLEHWRDAMTQVAALSNVVLKVGGIGMDYYYGTGWAALDAPPSSEQAAGYWSDHVRWCIDLFGPSRCMFESNFPVDRQALPYTVLWNAFQIIASDYDESEQADMFAGTAERVYRIDGS